MHKLAVNNVLNLKEDFVTRINEAAKPVEAAESEDGAAKQIDIKAIKSLLTEIFNQVKADADAVYALRLQLLDYQRATTKGLRIDSAIGQKHGYMDGVPMEFFQGVGASEEQTYLKEFEQIEQNVEAAIRKIEGIHKSYSVRINNLVTNYKQICGLHKEAAPENSQNVIGFISGSLAAEGEAELGQEFVKPAEAKPCLSLGIGLWSEKKAERSGAPESAVRPAESRLDNMEAGDQASSLNSNM